MTNTEALAAYRSNHKIHLEATDEPHVYRCSVDGLRVIPLIRGDRWRHHPDDIVKLLDAEYGGPWGGPKLTAISRIVEHRVGGQEPICKGGRGGGLGLRLLRKRGGGLRHHPDDVSRIVADSYTERVAFVAAPVVLDPTVCGLCGKGGPAHNASPRCQSGGYPHCSCDVCF